MSSRPSPSHDFCGTGIPACAFVAPASCRLSSCRSGYGARFLYRCVVIPSGTGVLSVRRFCARWGGGTGVLSVRRFCARWGSGTGVLSLRRPGARRRRGICFSLFRVPHLRFLKVGAFRSAGILPALVFGFSGAPPLVFRGGLCYFPVTQVVQGFRLICFGFALQGPACPHSSRLPLLRGVSREPRRVRPALLVLLACHE